MSSRDVASAKQKEEDILKIMEAAGRLLLLTKKQRKRLDRRNTKAMSLLLGSWLKKCQGVPDLNVGKGDLSPQDIDEREDE